MVFADGMFLYLFLPLCFVFYFIMPKVRMKNNVLILFSLIFYAWGQQLYVLLLLALSAVNYALAGLAGKRRGARSGKALLILALAVNIGSLAVFKYAGTAASAFGVSCPLKLPAGLSFFVFQNIYYTLESWQGKISAERGFGRYLLYISLFPKALAGPVVSYSQIAPELAERRTTAEDLSSGFTRVIFGLAKKTVLADNLHSAVISCFGQMSDGYAASGSLTAVTAWYGAALAALWCYFDFSAYSDIAIGLGRIFGFHFGENFNYPFASTSLSDFWQRWNISVVKFFRDCFYAPIFGRKRSYIGLVLMLLIIGLWHGASVNFILIGLLFGLLLALETRIGSKRMKKLPRVLAHIYTKLAAVIGFGIFYFEDTGALLRFLKALVGFGAGFTDTASNVALLRYSFLFIVSAVLSLPVVPALKKRTENEAALAAAGILCNILLLALSGAILFGRGSESFLYFRF